MQAQMPKFGGKNFLRPKSKISPHFKCECTFTRILKISGRNLGEESIWAKPTLKISQKTEMLAICLFLAVFQTYHLHFSSYWARNWLRGALYAYLSHSASLIQKYWYLTKLKAKNYKIWRSHPYLGIAFWPITQPFFVQFQIERYPRTQADINSYKLL